jgi:hypothetical protein
VAMGCALKTLRCCEVTCEYKVDGLTRAGGTRGWCRGSGSGAQCSMLPSLHHTHGRGRANDGIEQWAFTKVWCGAALTWRLLIISEGR